MLLLLASVRQQRLSVLQLLVPLQLQVLQWLLLQRLLQGQH